MNEYLDVDARDAVCFNCRLLTLRELNGDTVVFWCSRRHRPLKDRRLSQPCKHFKPHPQPFL